MAQRLSKNITATVGCDHEINIIDNSKNKRSIFEAYNLGLKKSKGDYILFLHEDVFIQTSNWGEKLSNIFKKDKDIGLIGVAGAKVKSKMPSAWWDCPKENQVMYLIQHFKNKTKELWDYGFILNNDIEEVVVIDGVFMMMKRIDQYEFDTSFTGFHNYDIDLSIAVKKQKLKVVVTNLILLEHFSKGMINKSWLKSSIKLYNKHTKILPLSVTKKLNHLNKLEISNGIKIINLLLDNNEKKIAIIFWIKLIVLKPFSRYHFKFLNLLFK